MDRLEQIFVRQVALTLNFHNIELRNGLCDYDDFPVPLTDPKAQKQLRSIAWYIIEEVGEVLDAKSLEEQQKEIVDVFHFLVELLISSGVTPDDLPGYGTDRLERLFVICIAKMENPALTFVNHLSRAMWYLKAKPWKANPKPTHPDVYKGKLLGVLIAFIYFAKDYSFTPELLFDMYMGKAQENQKRIDSGA
jgi:hypothetical protein